MTHKQPIARPTPSNEHMARFDDMTPGRERSFLMSRPTGEVAAYTYDDVLPALAAVDEACANGLWAAGFVAYEAAPGLDPDLQVRRSPSDDPFAGLPLVWFGLFEERLEIQPPEAGEGGPPSLWTGGSQRRAGQATTPPSRTSTNISPPATPIR